MQKNRQCVFIPILCTSAFDYNIINYQVLQKIIGTATNSHEPEAIRMNKNTAEDSLTSTAWCFHCNTAMKGRRNLHCFKFQVISAVLEFPNGFSIIMTVAVGLDSLLLVKLDRAG